MRKENRANLLNAELRAMLNASGGKGITLTGEHAALSQMSVYLHQVGHAAMEPDANEELLTRREFVSLAANIYSSVVKTPDRLNELQENCDFGREEVYSGLITAAIIAVKHTKFTMADFVELAVQEFDWQDKWRDAK